MLRIIDMVKDAKRKALKTKRKESHALCSMRLILNALLHYSITPLLHYSITPFFLPGPINNFQNYPVNLFCYGLNICIRIEIRYYPGS